MCAAFPSLDEGHDCTKRHFIAQKTCDEQGILNGSVIEAAPHQIHGVHGIALGRPFAAALRHPLSCRLRLRRAHLRDHPRDHARPPRRRGGGRARTSEFPLCRHRRGERHGDARLCGKAQHLRRQCGRDHPLRRGAGGRQILRRRDVLPRALAGGSHGHAGLCRHRPHL